MFSYFFPFYIRFSSSDDQVVWTQEVLLCCISYLRILEAVCSRQCSVEMLLNGMPCIEQCISLFLKSTLSEQEKVEALKKMEQLLVKYFEVVKKWLNENLLREFPRFIREKTYEGRKVRGRRLPFLKTVTFQG